jgi:hypothetical protein
MRQVPVLALVLCLANVVGAARADDRDKALAVIDQAIRARGGEQQLAKLKLLKRTAKGVTIQGAEIPFKEEIVLQLPDRFHWDMELDAMGQKVSVVLVLNGAKGWRQAGGMSAEMGNDEREDLGEELYVIWLTTLVPLKDKAFDLAPLPETEVNGRPAAGVKVACKGHAEAKLYFDRDSHLLVKLQRRARAAGQAVTRDYLYGDYRDFDGVKCAGKQTEMINGKKTVEYTFTGYQFPSAVKEDLFGMP